MSARSRTQNRPHVSSDSSTPSGSHSRSTTIRNRESPYSSLTRHKSDSGNNSPSTTLKRLSKSKKFINNVKTEALGLQLSNTEQQQQSVTTDEDADHISDIDDESPKAFSKIATQFIRPSITSAISATENVRNLTINDSISVIPKGGHGFDVVTNQPLPLSNTQVYQLFDQMQNELFRCKLCQKVRS